MKKILSAAVLLALAGAAQAEVSVYGLIDLSIGKNIADDAKGNKVTFHSGGDDSSSQGNSTTRIGIKGGSDLGSGLKANFKLESGGITSNGSVGSTNDPFFNRQAWAGVSGSFGEVRLGRQDSVPFQAMIDYDFNGAANAASAYGNVAAAPWQAGRQSRSLQYIAPDMDGLKVQVGLSAANTADKDKSTASIGVNYTVGALTVGATAESKRIDGGSNFTAVAVRYDLGVAKVAAHVSNGGKDLRGVGLGVTAPIAGFNVGVQVARNSDTKATGVELFANREIFKNTYAYADIGTVNKTTNTSTKGKAYALGVIYAF